MQKQAPSLGRIATMVIFALSCFGLLLFLWLAFGGATPLKPQGYRFHITFPEAGQLAQQADVRISGVSVGTVTKVVASKDGTTDAEVQLQSKYAPLPQDSRAMLRQKTLLGETYVELTPGRPNVPKIPENGQMARVNVAPTVELDEILSTFDPVTRKSFETWIQQVAVAAAGRGRGLSDALGTLPPFAENTTQLLALINSQQGAVNKLVRNSGIVFDALSTRQGQLAGAIRSANTVFATTAARDEALRQTFIALPTFEKESETTLRALDAFAKNTNPLVTDLHPVAAQLTPTLQQVEIFAPILNTLFENLDPVITASKKGLPATRSILKQLPPLLAAFDAPLRQLIPIFQGVSFYKPELAAFLANTAAATQALDAASSRPIHYLRTVNPLSPENLAAFPNRFRSNRSSAYSYPGAFDLLKTGLKQYETRGCTKPEPTLGGGTPPAWVLTPNPPNPTIQMRLAYQAFLGNADGSKVVAIPCSQQGQFPILPTANGTPGLTTYPHVTASTTTPAKRRR